MPKVSGVANRKAGSSALADWLNEQGYRTKNGRLWSKESVITVLRNRVYIGEIYYRGNWYPAPHEPLIPKELFDKAQAIPTERREDRSKRAANPAEYLLTGRVRCGRCGQAYVGTAAHGRTRPLHLLHLLYASALRHQALCQRPATCRAA